MKKKYIVLAVVLIAGLVVLAYPTFIVIRRTSVAVNKTAAATEKTLQAIEKAKPYTIEQISPEWIMIRSKNNRWGKYAEALAEGLKELGRDYTIISIEPIQEHHLRESPRANFSAPVQALLVEVKPKY